MNGDHGEPTVPRNRYVAACLTLVAALSLAACTGDSGSTVPTTNVPVTSSPAPSVPVPIAPVQEKSRDSAEAFAVYFWDLYNYAHITNDTKPLEAISDQACHFCASATELVRKRAEKGTKSAGLDVTVIDVYTPPAEPVDGALVTTDIKQTPGLLTDSSGKVTKSSGWKLLQTSFSLLWKDGKWSVEGVELATSKGVPWQS